MLDSGSPGLAPGSHGLTARQDTLPQLPMRSGTSTLMPEQMELPRFALGIQACKARVILFHHSPKFLAAAARAP